MTVSPVTRRSLLGAALVGGRWATGRALTTNLEVGTSFALADFGGGPAAADNTTPLRAALLAAKSQGGGQVVLGNGVYRFASTALGQSGVAFPANVTLRGAGRDLTRLHVIGETACNLLVAEDQQRIAIEDLTIIGNAVSAPHGSVYGIGAAIRWILTERATAGVSGFALRRVHLENFRCPYWIEIQNLSHPKYELEMCNIEVNDLTFTSRPGNSIRPDNLGFNAAVICIGGHNGAIKHVRINRVSGNAKYIKSGIILYQHINDAILDYVYIVGAGRDGATDNKGGYAIQIYDSVEKMASIKVSNAIIRSPRSAGIYVAGAKDVIILNPDISGQTDTQSGTLPKGAIVFNGTQGWEVKGGVMTGNECDFDIAMPDYGRPEAPCPVAGRIFGVRSQDSTSGIAIRYSAGYVAAGIRIEDCHWRSRGRTVLIRNSAEKIMVGASRQGGYVDDIVFDRCHLEAAVGYRALDLWGVSGSPAGGYVIANSTLIGTNPLYARAQTGSIQLSNCTVRDHGATAGSAAASLIDCPRLNLSDCTFDSPGPGGVGIDLAGSRGTTHGLRFVHCTYVLPPALVPVQLGRTKPTFNASAGQQVQNLAGDGALSTGWVSLGDGRWKASDD